MRRSIVEENRKWRWSDIGVWMKNSVQAIIKGQFLMRLQIEKTLTKVEENQKRLDDMEIYHAQKVVELVGLNRLTTVRNLLHEKGSQVDIPQQPAVTIKKK